MPAARPNIQDFTVSIPIPDHYRLKVAAASERRSMNAIVIEAVRNYLDLTERTREKSGVASA